MIKNVLLVEGDLFMPAENIQLVGLVGSVRERSYNGMLLEAVRELLPDAVTLEVLPIAQLPFYDQDVDLVAPPSLVERMREQVRNADGLVVATPEYNYTISGVLKNAIEWLSRPTGASVILGKPVMLMGATTGMWGTIRAQMALRQIFISTNNPVLNRPEVLVAQAQNKFDVEGRLTDPLTLTILQQSLDSFLSQLRPASAPELAASSAS